MPDAQVNTIGRTLCGLFALAIAPVHTAMESGNNGCRIAIAGLPRLRNPLCAGGATVSPEFVESMPHRPSAMSDARNGQPNRSLR